MRGRNLAAVLYVRQQKLDQQQKQKNSNSKEKGEWKRISAIATTDNEWSFFSNCNPLLPFVRLSIDLDLLSERAGEKAQQSCVMQVTVVRAPFDIKELVL